MLSTLTLQNFRNYEKLDLQIPEDKLTVITGNNGEGKTNILEAIYLLSLAKSFRAKKYTDLIKWTKNYTRIHCQLKNKTEREIYLSDEESNKKVLKQNGQALPANKFIGDFPVVLFTPEDLNLISYTPQSRRRYLDILNSELNREYLDKLIQYKKILKSRNRILFKIKEQNANLSELEFWDKELIERGSYLIQKRLEQINFFNQKLTPIYQKIAKTKDKLTLNYIPGFKIPEDYSRIPEIFTEELKNSLERDIKFCSTHIGLHRDDFSFLLNSKNVIHFASRGDYRTIIIGLKLAELDLKTHQKGVPPILLLDDVFSELDQERRKTLLKEISKYQTIITTSSMEYLAGYEGEMERVEVKGGEVK